MIAAPVTVAVIVDVSGSQHEVIDDNRELAKQLAAQWTDPMDKVFVVTVARHVKLLPSSLEGLDDKQSAGSILGDGCSRRILSLGRCFGSTIWESVFHTSNLLLKDAAGQKAIILITDGLDRGSRRSLIDAIEAAQDAKARVFAVHRSKGISKFASLPLWNGDEPARYLRKLANETGGELIEEDGASRFVNRVAADVRYWNPSIRPAPPSIDQWGIRSAASLFPTSLPMGALARGSRIVIQGVRLGPRERVPAAGSPLPLELAGTEVEVDSGGLPYLAQLLSVSEERIEAVLPLDLPLGPASIIVRYSGQPSIERPVDIVASNFGIFRSSPTAPVRHEELVTLTGTGLGSAGRSSLRAWMGGAVSDVIFARPDGAPGIDRIQFRVPRHAPEGCNVPVVIQSGKRFFSNTAFLPVSDDGPCKDVGSPLAALSQTGRVGLLALNRAQVSVQLQPGVALDFVADSGLARFQAESAQLDLPVTPLGSCAAFISNLSARELLTPTRLLGMRPLRSLDAGPELRIIGSSDTRKLQPLRGGSNYSDVIGLKGSIPQVRRPPLLLEAGVYRIESDGGKDVGSFSATIDMPAIPAWSGKKRPDVERGRDYVMEWSGGGDGWALVFVIGTDTNSGLLSGTQCTARANDGRFQVPAAAMANIPGSPPKGIAPSVRAVLFLPAQPQTAEASGLEHLVVMGTTALAEGITIEF